ncbi:MAG: tetratricopeptide repeat protein [Acidimicrobiales bacterium]
MSTASRAELEDERRFLLDSLRDLERERESGDIDEGDYESLREDYTARAAEVLRALEAHDEAVASERPRRAQRAGSAGGSRKLVAGVLLVGMVALAGGSVFVLAGDRQAGEPITGSLPDSASPADRLALAHQLEGQGEVLEALKLYDAVLKDEPDNVEAITYRGWLLKLAGLVDPAQAALNRAVTIDPAYPDARFFRGMLLYQDRKDPVAAVPEFEAFLASNPPESTRQAVQDVLDRARADAAPPTTPAPPSPPSE